MDDDDGRSKKGWMMTMAGLWQEKLVVFVRRLLFMCQKELLTTLKDKRMRAMMVVPALMQGFLFGYAASYNLDNVPYAVVDESHSEASRSLLGHFAGSGCFQQAAYLTSPHELGSLIDSEQIIMAVVIPRDFEQKLQRGELAEVQVRSRTWFNPNQITRWIFSPGLIAMIAFVQVLLLAGMSIAREREQGTFDQLMVTPLSPAEILLGKAVPPMLIGLVQSTILFCIARFWFQIPFAGSLVTLYLALILFIFSLIGVGLMISAISDSMQQVMVYLMVLMMPMVLLSGLTTPVINMPDVLQYATYADPLRFAVDAVRRIYLEGAAAGELLGDFVPLLIIAAVTLPLSGWLFYNKTV